MGSRLDDMFCKKSSLLEHGPDLGSGRTSISFGVAFLPGDLAATGSRHVRTIVVL